MKIFTQSKHRDPIQQLGDWKKKGFSIAILACLIFGDAAFAEKAPFDQQSSCWIEADYLLWLCKVIRPGKQIDRKINTTFTALADASRATVGTGPGPIPLGDSSGLLHLEVRKDPGSPSKPVAFMSRVLRLE